MNRLTQFVRAMLDGYEPAVVRSIAVAIFVLAAALGKGTGELPSQVEAVLTFLQFIVPIAAGFAIRAKVIPVADETLLPPNPYDEAGE